MALFFKALDSKGKLHKGFFANESETDLVQYLEDQNWSLVTCFLKSQKSFLTFKSNVSEYELQEFCFYVATLDRSGLTIVEILEAIGKTFSNKNFTFVLSDMTKSLKQGKTLSQSCASHPKIFDTILCAMIAAGEHRGHLAPTFEELAQFIKWRCDIKNRIWKSLRYPLLILIFVMILITILIVGVVPQLIDFLLSFQKELSISTKILIFTSQYADKFLMILASLFTISIASVWSLKKFSYKAAVFIDHLVLSFPLIGSMIEKVELQRFLQIFVSLLKRNVPILSALSLSTQSVNNLFFQNTFEEIQKSIEQGLSLSQSWIQIPDLNPLIARLAFIGEKSGQLAESLTHGIHFLKRDIDHHSEKLLSILEPTAMIILGSLILWITMSILLPLYDQMASLSS